MKAETDAISYLEGYLEGKKAGAREMLDELVAIDKDAYDARDFTRRVCDLIVERQLSQKNGALSMPERK